MITFTLSLSRGARRLLQARSFTLAAVLTLALGLGATTAIFSVVHAVLLRPLPYPEPDRLVSLSHTLDVGGMLRVDQSDASLLFYQRHHGAFTHFGGYQPTAAGLGPVGGEDAERVVAARVAPGVFRALGVAPLRGRTFTEADDRPGAAPVVAIGERLWARKYGGDPGLLHRRIVVEGVSHEVVGIMPARVRFPASDTELWLPLRLDPAKTDSATFDYQAIARLRDGTSVGAAETELQSLLERLPDEFPGRLTHESIEQTHMRASARPLAEVVIGAAGRPLWVVFGAAALVLAIACANVASLFLVRAEGRRSALGIQRALGATRADMLLEFLGEGLLVSLVAGGLGLVAAVAGVEALGALDGIVDIPRLWEVDIDVAVVGAAALIALVASVVVSALAALRSGAATAALSAMSRSATAGRDRHLVRHGLVVSQVALALVLLVGSGLMARSVWRLRAVHPGFEPAHALAFRLALPSAAYPRPDDSVRFFVRALHAVAAIPGVEAAGATSKLPLDEQGRTDTAVFPEDRPIPPGSLPGIHPVIYVTPGYFGAAGIPFRAGRTFTRPDPPRVSHEAVVSRAFAERYWKNEPPIGKRVRILMGGPWYTVVGVVGDVRDKALDQPEDQLLYCPLLPAQEDPRWTPRDLAFIVRTVGEPTAATGAVRDAVRGLDASLPLYRFRELTDILAQASARRSLTFVLIVCASVVALLLGAIGLYGVMSYSVTLRTRELGIRLALGAQPDAIRRMVARQGLSIAALGIAAGLAGAMVAMRSLSALLFEVSPNDPAVLAVAALFLLAVAALASTLPARRAALLDPASTLRAE